MERCEELAPLSRDHHVALARALRLRRATPEDVQDVVRAFADFFEHDGASHFAVEEEVLGPHLTAADDRRLRQEHAALREAAARCAADPAAVDVEEARRTGELLAAHVRWEERELFEALQDRLPADALAAVGHGVSAGRG